VVAPTRDESVFEDFQSISSWTAEQTAAKLSIWASDLVLARRVPGNLLLTQSEAALHDLFERIAVDDAKKLYGLLQRSPLPRSERDGSVFDDIESIASWTAEECGVKLGIWAPDLVRTWNFDGHTLLSISAQRSEAALRFHFKELGDEDAQSLLRLLQSRPKKRANDLSAQQACQSRAFSTEYRDPKGEVEDFVRFVRSCSAAYRKKPFYFLAPYVSVVQSSGYGKTRLMLQSSHHIRTMYVCMRPKSATGFPERSNAAMAALFGNLNTKDADTYSFELARKFELCWYSAVQNLPEPGKGCVNASRFQCEEMATQVWNLDAVRIDTSRASNELVLLIFDEARVTLAEDVEGISQFRLIRRALWMYSQSNSNKNPILAIFIDTSSTIQNFAPSSLHDPSLRPMLLDMEVTAKEMFRPWIVRGSFDALFQPLPATTENLEALLTSDMYLRAGRPMLSVFERLGQVEELNFLSRKLRGGRSEINQQAALSHMLCRIAAYVYPQHPFSTELVAEYMATILVTDAKRISSLVAYVAEPKLAVAAALQWQQPTIFATKFLPALQQALAGGALDHGSRGKLVAQILVLCAFDKACAFSGKRPGECVVLRSVLEQLLPEGTDPGILDALPAHLLQSYSACCQFVNLCHRFGHGEIVALAERHCGASLRDCQMGVDLAVAILGKVASLFLIQVKNWNSNTGITAKALMELDPEIAFAKDKFSAQQRQSLRANSVRVVMQLGASICRAKTKPDTNGHIVLELFGIGARCLDQDARSALGVLLNEHVSVGNFIANDGNDKEEDHDFGPDASTLKKIRSAWPFIAEPNPTLMDLTKKELIALCKHYGIPTGTQNKSQLIQSLLACTGASGGEETSGGGGMDTSE
jgi:hypothetical protein